MSTDKHPVEPPEERDSKQMREEASEDEGSSIAPTDEGVDEASNETAVLAISTGFLTTIGPKRANRMSRIAGFTTDSDPDEDMAGLDQITFESIFNVVNLTKDFTRFDAGLVREAAVFIREKAKRGFTSRNKTETQCCDQLEGQQQREELQDDGGSRVS